MDELVANDIKIENMIYEVRGKQVMLDSDLAMLYKIETKKFNQAVKRNIERFPQEFMFQLSDIEFLNLRSQFVTSNSRGGRRYLPHVFTEQGIAMLASVLHTDIAIQTSIKIINAFVSMKKYISSNLIEQRYINNLVVKHDEEIKLLQESFKKFDEKKKTNEIYFYGQIYDAYSKIIDIFYEAKKELIIIDGYTDKTLLDMIKNITVNVILITKKDTKITKLDIDKYNKQYHNLRIIYDDTFHDRYFIIDRELFYHSGTSINHAGNRTFSINMLEDLMVKKTLITNIIKITNITNM